MLYHFRTLLFRSLKKLVGFEPSSKGQIALYEANTLARQLEHEYNAFTPLLDQRR